RYATTIFAFGQTGSGKSYTVTGEKNFEFDAYQSGLVLRSLRYLYDQVTERSHIKFNIKAAYLEIYNEHVQDLMSLTNTVSLPVRFQASRGFYVENLLVLDCHAIDDCVAVLQEGLRNRTTRAHQLNEHSSRSHSIMTVYIDTEQPDPNGGKPLVKHGKISFVDLAGSEKVRETKSTGETFNEMLNINKSLLTLGNCISALSDPKKRGGHIPYRDSNLTRLLADSLGGSGLALMIACVSPSGRHASETLKTLRYAQRTKRIRNRPIVHMDPRDEVVENLTKEVTQLRIENQYLKSMLGGSGMVSSNVSSGYVSPRSISSVDRGGGGVSLPSIPSGPVSYTGSPAPSSVGSSASHWRQSTSGSSVSEYAGGMQSPASMHSPSVGYASGRRSASSRPVKSSPLNSSKTHSGKTNIPAPPITTYTGQSRRQLGTKRHAVASSAPEMR
ncbi:P-loop containing nucleoside triphosphate hydrolase protein, partial [Powellomyces hirtus]